MTCNQSYNQSLDFDHEENRSFRLSMAAFSVLIEMVSSTLLLGIIMYERYGGDPQKRTLLNQLVSSLGFAQLAHNLIPFNILILRLLIGQPLNYWLLEITFFVSRAALTIAGYLTMNQMIIFRFMATYVWKRVPPINDDFFGKFLLILNLSIGTVLGTFGNLDVSEEQRLRVVMIGASEIDACDPSAPDFKIYKSVMCLTVVIHCFAGSRLFFGRLKHFFRQTRGVSASQQGSTSPARYNTTSKNQDMFSSVVILLSVVTLVAPFLTFFGQKDSSKNLDPISIYTYMLFMLGIVTPLNYWIRNHEIPKFFLRSLREGFQ